MIIFVVFNVIISVAVASLVISLRGGQSASGSSPIIVTVPIVYTATIGPSQTPYIITATLPDNVVTIPTGLISSSDLTNEPLPTFDSSGDTSLQGTATALPTNCILHVVKEGDTPFAIAEQYGASGFDLLQVNGLNEETATQIQIGDVLIVPLPGCPLIGTTVANDTTSSEPTATPTAGPTEATIEVTPSPTILPTVTLAPTATNAQVQIVDVLKPGDITQEGVEIRNVGGVVDLTGWVLSDASGDTFTFPEQRLFTNSLLTVYSRVGDNTPIALYWGRSAPVWAAGDVVTLKDKDGHVQSTFRVPAAVNLP